MSLASHSCGPISSAWPQGLSYYSDHWDRTYSNYLLFCVEQDYVAFGASLNVGKFIAISAPGKVLHILGGTKVSQLARFAATQGLPPNIGMAIFGIHIVDSKAVRAPAQWRSDRRIRRCSGQLRKL